MDLKERVEHAKRTLNFISTKFDETDEEIKGALASLVEHIGKEAEAIKGRRKAISDAAAAKAKEIQDAKDAHVASGAPPLPVITAELG